MSFSLKKSPKWIPSKYCTVFVILIRTVRLELFFQKKIKDLKYHTCDLHFSVFLPSSQTFPEEFRISGRREKKE